MSRIFELFSREFVRFTLKRNLKQSIEHNGTLKVIEQPKEIEGYFNEECDKYYYVGVEPTQVNTAIDKSDVSTVDIIDINALKDELLKSYLDDSDTSGGMN